MINFVAGDTKHEENRVHEGHVDGGIGDFFESGLGVKRNAQTGHREHVDVVGTISYRNGLVYMQPGIFGEGLETAGLLLPIDDFADNSPSKVAIFDLQGVGLVEI